MRSMRLLICVALLTLTACGPTIPLKAGLADAPSDILFGHPPASPPPPPLPQVQNFAAPLELPPVQSAPPATFSPIPAPPTPPACPDASPFAFPGLEATASATKPPAAATYNFRYKGTITEDPGQPDQKVTTVPTSGTRQVIPTSQPSSVDGSYTYSVVETFNGQQLKNDFEVYPAGHTVTSTQTLLPTKTPDAGIYFTGMTMTTIGSNSPATTFTPDPPIQVDVFDDFNGQTWQGGSGTDPTTQKTAAVAPNGSNPNSSVVTQRVRVNACGEVVQAWEVDLAGTFGDAQGSTSSGYSLTLDFATQYGGISVQDHLTLNDTDVVTGKGRSYDLTATTDQTPKLP